MKLTLQPYYSEIQVAVKFRTSWFHGIFAKECISKVWILQNFSAREIKIAKLRDLKSAAIFTHLEEWISNSMNFYTFSESWKLSKWDNSDRQNGKNDSCRASRFSKIDFTENLSDRKILKYVQCLTSSQTNFTKGKSIY